MDLPELERPVIATVQHFHTKGIRKCELRRVDESDLDWRFCDDNSELSYDWDVIAWKYSKESQ